MDTPHTVSVENSDTDATVSGAGEQAYEIPGFIASINSKYLDAEKFTIGIAQEIFDRWGRGIPAVEINCLPSVTAKLGAEVILNLIHLPVSVVGNTPVTQRGGQRIYQIVYRTETPSGPTLKLLDAGTVNAPATAPTFTVAANAADARKLVDITLTNAGALIAAGLKAKVWIATGTSAPASGSGRLLTTMDPNTTTSLLAQPFDAGTKVWVQMQSVKNDQRPGALTAWASVTLTGLNPPTGLAVTAESAGDVSRRTLTWTVGATDIAVEVSLRLTSESVAANRIVALLPPGSTQFELTGLDTANRTASVRHRESSPFDGVSTYATVAVNTSGTSPRTLNPPINPRVFSSAGGVFGMDVNATEFPSLVEFQVKVGAGGTFETVTEVPSELNDRTRWQGIASNDGVTRYLRARHVAAGLTSSAWTTTLSVPPWSDTGASSDTNSVFAVSAAPGAELGVNGDWAIDAALGRIYGPKAGGVWPAAYALVGIPTGGTTGQVLAKLSNTNYNAGWTAASGTGYRTAFLLMGG